ncbi:MAG: SRPBCC domain-containing protein [Chloroflexota bacterium]|nr:SRPBCC domain-containing protein [Chloroflexota bacterium]
MDLRPGGKWRYVSSAPDRDDIEFYGEYLEIVPPERMKWTFMFDSRGRRTPGWTGDVDAGRRRWEDADARHIAHGISGGHRRCPGDRHDAGRHRDLGPPRRPSAPQRRSRAAFSANRTFTTFVTSATGMGSSAWNRIVPFPAR